MLNLTQRLILGCALMACLTVGLVAVTHRALHASGQLGFAWIMVAATLVVEIGTVYAVLRPIHRLAHDAQKIAQGNLDHRADWISRDCLGFLPQS